MTPLMKTLSTGGAHKKKDLENSETNNANTQITYSQVQPDADFIKMLLDSPNNIG